MNAPTAFRPIVYLPLSRHSFSVGGHVTGNGTTGINIPAGSVTNCTANNNEGTGIFVELGSVINSTAIANGNDGIRAISGVVAFCVALDNNKNNSGSANIDAAGATRTGNNPTP